MLELYKNEMFGRYFDFKGRTKRHDFWVVFALNFLLGMGICLLSIFVNTMDSSVLTAMVGLLFFVVYAGLIVPTLAITVRRLTDVGKHWAWLLISFIPFGGLVLLYFYLKPSI